MTESTPASPAAASSSAHQPAGRQQHLPSTGELVAWILISDDDDCQVPVPDGPVSLQAGGHRGCFQHLHDSSDTLAEASFILL